MIHGGGFVIGSVEVEHAGAARWRSAPAPSWCRSTTAWRPSTPTRLACTIATPRWRSCTARRSALGVDPDRIAVAGTSAGGGLAAATALLARDRGGPAVCFQMLHIPELDDRLQTVSMQAFVDSPMWNRPLAEQSWRAYLGPLYGSADVPSYAAPARATDLSGLPPAYISTAENDPLRDEGITYAQRLLQAGVSVELHQFPGTFHGSAVVTTAAVSRRAQRESTLVLRQALGVEGD